MGERRTGFTAFGVLLRAASFATVLGMERDKTATAIADEVPWSDTVTDYDEAHFVVYLRLLDAQADNASTHDMARIVLGIDPVREPQRARIAVETHLSRARWMTEHGYKDLLKD